MVIPFRGNAFSSKVQSPFLMKTRPLCEFLGQNGQNSSGKRIARNVAQNCLKVPQFMSQISGVGISSMPGKEAGASVR